MQQSNIKYDDQFKRIVVELLEDGTLKSIEEARRLFLVKSSSIITVWARKLGKEHILPKVKVRTIEEETERLKDSHPEIYEAIIKRL